MRVGIRRRAAHVTRIGKQIRRAPEQLHARRFLQRLCVRDDLVQIAIRLGQRPALRRDVAVMKRIKRRLYFREKLKRRIHPRLRDGNRVLPLFPWPHNRARAERVGPDAAKRMPVGNRKPEMILQCPAVDDLGGIVMPECERIGARRAFVANRFDFGEMRCSHGRTSVLLRAQPASRLSSRFSS